MSASKKPPLILASASPRRREILEKFGFRVTVRVPKVLEIELGQNGCHTPEQMVMQNARLKAEAVPTDTGWILASDTTVFFNGKEYGKPKNHAEAIRFLTELSGNTHEVYSSYCLRNQETEHLGFDVARVTFRRLNLKEIERYIETVHVMDKAGAYAIQEGGERIVEKLEGSFHTVMGLPIERILEILKNIST